MDLSSAERKGISCGIRCDGRASLDSRKVILETGLIAQAAGSCRMKVIGGSHVLVGVKAQVGQINPQIISENIESVNIEAKDVGRIQCFVECSSAAKQSSVTLDKISNQYTQLLNRTLNGSHSGIKLDKLVIIPATTCWVLTIDVLVLELQGNLLDVILMCVRAALINTEIPKCKVESIDGIYDFDISDDEIVGIEGAADLGVGVTLSFIGGDLVIDTNLEEESCADASVCIIIGKTNNLPVVCGIQKLGNGSMNPSVLQEMLQVSRQIGIENIESIDEYLAEEQSARHNDATPLGFYNIKQ